MTNTRQINKLIGNILDITETKSNYIKEVNANDLVQSITDLEEIKTQVYNILNHQVKSFYKELSSLNNSKEIEEFADHKYLQLDKVMKGGNYNEVIVRFSWKFLMIDVYNIIEANNNKIVNRFYVKKQHSSGKLVDVPVNARIKENLYKQIKELIDKNF